MLSGLSIRNIVLIERLDLPLEPGLCVMTGETGAGKSILLDALGLTLGARADASLIRHGTAQATVSAEFCLPADHPAQALVTEQDIPAGDSLILRRVLSGDGRSRAFINDQAVSVGLLRQIGGLLVEIHGQHDERGLLNPAGHRALLDAFGGLAEEATALRSAYETWRAVEEMLARAQADVASAQAEESFLRHAVEELAALAPKAGEEERLAEERALMSHAEKVMAEVAASLALVAGDDGAETRLSAALRHLDRAADKAGGLLEGAIAALERARVEAQEAADALQSAGEALQFEPQRLETIAERLFALRALARKHGVAVDELETLQQSFLARLVATEDTQEMIGQRERMARQAREDYLAAARALSDRRQAAAERLDAAVNAELAPLKLDKARFRTRIDRVSDQDAGPEGIDRVEFQVTTNPGAPLGPLIRIASGGELARFILALKVALAAEGAAGTLVFDEVDRGVGGAVADAVGERLARLADRAQVLVVTHSPQVAARGRHHWRISKQATEDGTTVTRVEVLDAAARREEIARMLAGAEVTEEARAAAQRLLSARPAKVAS
jgi:DNA repair protein RecN (Recombination protein N)